MVCFSLMTLAKVNDCQPSDGLGGDMLSVDGPLIFIRGLF